MQADAIDLLGEQLSQLDLWTRVPPGERRTRITREELAEAAVRIADTEGSRAPCRCGGSPPRSASER